MHKKSQWMFISILTIVCLLLVNLAMAQNEITVNTMLKLIKGEVNIQRTLSGLQFDQEGDSFEWHVQSIGTSTHELITINTDVATNGWSFWRNTTTNTDRYVETGGQDTSGVFVATARLEATEPKIGRLHPTNAIYGKAYGGAVNLEVLILED